MSNSVVSVCQYSVCVLNSVVSVSNSIVSLCQYSVCVSNNVVSVSNSAVSVCQCSVCVTNNETCVMKDQAFFSFMVFYIHRNPNITTRMIPAFRWAAMRTILMSH